MATSATGWTKTKSVAAFIGILILVAILAAVAFYTQPAPTEPFTADGKQLGDFQIGTNWYNIFQIVFGTEIDKTWVTTSSIIQYLFLPLVAIFLLMYAIFEEIGFFRRLTWFNPVLGIVAALIISSSGILIRMMRGYLMLAGGMGIVFFGFILFLGLLLWFVRRLAGFGIPLGKVAEAGTRQVKVMEIERMIAVAENYAKNLPDTDRRKVDIIAKVTDARLKIVRNQVDQAETSARQATDLCARRR